MEARQRKMVAINELVGKNHPYRRLKELRDFGKTSKLAKVEESPQGAIGYGKRCPNTCRVLQ